MDTDCPIAAPVRIRWSQWRDLASLSVRKSVERAESRLVGDGGRRTEGSCPIPSRWRRVVPSRPWLVRLVSLLSLATVQRDGKSPVHVISASRVTEITVGLMGGHGGVRRVGYRHAEQLKVGRRVHAIRGGWYTEFMRSTWSRCPCLGCTPIYYVLEALSAASCGCVEVYSALMYLSPNMNMMYRPDYRVFPLSTIFPSDTVWV